MGEPFLVKDCALLTLATGKKAQNLQELRDRIMTAHPGSIYYHFWGGMLRSSFNDPEYPNDFAVWAWRGIHDALLAERLALIDPSDYPDMEDLRQEVIDVIEERLDETEHLLWALKDHQFYLLRSQIVIFDTDTRLHDVESLARYLPRCSRSSIFYHFIDSRRRSASRRDDFSEWLMGLGEDHSPLIDSLAAIDPYFSTLTELREEIAQTMTRYVDRGKSDAIPGRV